MSKKRMLVAMVLCVALGLAFVAAAQWDEDEEPQRIEDQQREEVLYQGSEADDHQESVHMPAKKEPPAPVPPPGTYETPDQEIEGPSTE